MYRVNTERTSDQQPSWIAVFLASDIVRNANVDAGVFSTNVSYPQTPRLCDRQPLSRLHRLAVLAPSHTRFRLTSRRSTLEQGVRADGQLDALRMFYEVGTEYCNQTRQGDVNVGMR